VRAARAEYLNVSATPSEVLDHGSRFVLLLVDSSVVTVSCGVPSGSRTAWTDGKIAEGALDAGGSVRTKTSNLEIWTHRLVSVFVFRAGARRSIEPASVCIASSTL
jgi:hypothetical protein